MDWNMVGAIGESVGAALLFISIVYLAIQVKSAKQVIAVETAQRVRSEHHATYAALATSSALSEALSAEVGGDPKQVHVAGWYFWCVSNWENQYDLYRLGLVDQSIMDRTAAAFQNFVDTRPSFRAWWQNTKFTKPGLREYMESRLSDEQRATLRQGQEVT
jgi:hypothetical protein